MSRRDLVQEYFNERIVWGGCLFTKGGLIRVMQKMGYTAKEIEWTLAYDKTTQEDIDRAVNGTPNKIPEGLKEMFR